MPSEDPPKPQSRVQMDPNYEKRLREIKDAAKAESSARGTGDQVKWFRPAGWSGDPEDFDAMSSPFSRKQSNDDAVQAISDPKNPGTTGDIVAAQTMIDVLSCMERSFRMRHTMGRARATAHMAARKKGHGQDTGAVMNNGVEFVRGIIQQARAES